MDLVVVDVASAAAVVVTIVEISAEDEMPVLGLTVVVDVESVPIEVLR